MSDENIQIPKGLAIGLHKMLGGLPETILKHHEDSLTALMIATTIKLFCHEVERQCPEIAKEKVKEVNNEQS